MKLIHKLKQAFLTIFTVLKGSLVQFTRQRGPESAAAIAFFTVFSLFPLLVLIVSAGSFFLERPQMVQSIFDILNRFLPQASQSLIEKNLESILKSRGTMSIISIGGLIWAATGMFNILERNLTRAWGNAHVRNIIISRMIAFVMVISLFVLLIAFLFLEAVLGVLQKRDQIWFGADLITPLIDLISFLSIYFFVFSALTFLYRFVPNTSVSWKSALSGAAGAFVLAMISVSALGWYIGSGFVKYNVVYGSLGTVVSLMFWIFIQSAIILWGGHLSAFSMKGNNGERNRTK